jgi:hypothetical protein
MPQALLSQNTFLLGFMKDLTLAKWSRNLRFRGSCSNIPIRHYMLLNSDLSHRKDSNVAAKNNGEK